MFSIHKDSVLKSGKNMIEYRKCYCEKDENKGIKKKQEKQ